MSGKQFRFESMLAARKRGSPALVAEDGYPDFGQCGGRMDEEKKRYSLGRRRRRSTSNMQYNVG